MDSSLRNRLWDCARQGRSRLLIPSGALGGLDYLRAARRVGAVQVNYRGCKPVAAWRGTEAERLIDLSAIDKSTVFFRGELVAEPGANANRHELIAHGAAGTIRLSVENSPLPANPKSSRITAFSILETVASHGGEL